MNWNWIVIHTLWMFYGFDVLPICSRSRRSDQINIGSDVFIFFWHFHFAPLLDIVSNFEFFPIASYSLTHELYFVPVFSVLVDFLKKHSISAFKGMNPAACRIIEFSKAKKLKNSHLRLRIIKTKSIEGLNKWKKYVMI